MASRQEHLRRVNADRCFVSYADCAFCGQLFVVRRARPAGNRPACRNPECKRAQQRERMRLYLADYKAKNGVRYEDRYRVERPCEVCGEPMQTRARATRMHRECALKVGQPALSTAGNAAQAARAAARKAIVLAGPVRVAETLRFRMAQERLNRAAAGTRSKRAVWVSASCVRCGTAFVCMWTNDLPRYCSRPCARSEGKAVRRARKYATRHVPYSRREIFERDRWRCKLCRKPVRRDAEVPDPLAPVIDHIVPLAAGEESGGVDAPWNVQCAHFLCNSVKRDQLVAPALF